MRNCEQREKHLAYMKIYNAKTRPTKKSQNIPNGNIGRTHSVEERQKRSKSLLGLKRSEDIKLKMRNSLNSGRFTSDKLIGNKNRVGKPAWNKGLKLSEERKARLYKIPKGKPSWNKGTKGLMSPNSGSFRKEQFIGDKNPNWKGGISHMPYAKEWTRALRHNIRERDIFKCRVCDKTQDDNGKKLDVHHIDYDKQNCNSINLISLCKSCHRRTNHNRDYWNVYFNNFFKVA